MNESPSGNVEWKEPDTVECLLFDSIYVKFTNKKIWSLMLKSGSNYLQAKVRS